ncbi:ABC transporter permease [Galbitalea sp. SE-J8]|uniref:ABC transporter permease n=1 Tax=Galbitalea sp. SE-J8 TaxID=3054952 RepID=UPI00259C8E14|nr:ABC transporter permease [Galbitalea sp. SE-J8]MDM4762442.1 ABC transporter permease [Galbitalea sp. SE-J8]
MTSTAASARPRRYGALYVTEHRLRLVRSWRWTFIATTLGNPIIYLYSLGVGLATLVHTAIPIGDGREVSYLVYVAPALIASAAMTAAVEESMFPYLEGFKWNETFFAINSAPITGRQIVDGTTIWIAIRVVPTTIVYLVIAALFGAVTSAGAGLVVVIATAAGLAMGLLVSSYTATIREDRGQMAIIMRIIVMPLFLFSGTFFPLESLPIGLQWIGWVSPLWHGTQLSRVVAFGLAEPIWLTVAHVGYLAALAALGLWRTRAVVTARLDR